LTALHPEAVKAGEWSFSPEQFKGTLVEDGAGIAVELGNTLVLSVLGVEGVEVVGGTLLEGVGTLGTRFASTSLSKPAFWPSERSKVQCPNDECTLNVDLLFAGSLGSLAAYA
jgi:hypothetical protein